MFLLLKKLPICNFNCSIRFLEFSLILKWFLVLVKNGMQLDIFLFFSIMSIITLHTQCSDFEIVTWEHVLAPDPSFQFK